MQTSEQPPSGQDRSSPTSHADSLNLIDQELWQALSGVFSGVDKAKAHTSITAPKCVGCRHFRDDRFCAHPAAGVDLVLGRPTQLARHMRGVDMARAEKLGVVGCGPQAVLFAPVDGLPDLRQRVLDFAQQAGYLSQALIAHLGGVGLDQGRSKGSPLGAEGADAAVAGDKGQG